MNRISQLMKYRRSMVEYALKHGVTKTAIKYNTYRQYVYRWLRRYDGSLESLRNKSRRPKHHPKAHTAAELKLIQDMRRRDPEAGLVVFWVKLVSVDTALNYRTLPYIETHRGDSGETT